VAQFLSDYPQIIEEAKTNLNGLFNPLEYPANVEDKFSISVNMMPVPDSADFRVQLSEEEISDLKNDIEAEVNKRLNNAASSLRNRIREQLIYMRDRLIDPDGIFRDSLFDNLDSLVGLIPKLNITNDAYVADLGDKMRELLVNPQAVRDDKKLREELVLKINSMI